MTAISDCTVCFGGRQVLCYLHRAAVDAVNAEIRAVNGDGRDVAASGKQKASKGEGGSAHLSSVIPLPGEVKPFGEGIPQARCGRCRRAAFDCVCGHAEHEFAVLSEAVRAALEGKISLARLDEVHAETLRWFPGVRGGA